MDDEGHAFKTRVHPTIPTLTTNMLFIGSVIDGILYEFLMDSNVHCLKTFHNCVTLCFLLLRV